MFWFDAAKVQKHETPMKFIQRTGYFVQRKAPTRSSLNPHLSSLNPLMINSWSDSRYFRSRLRNFNYFNYNNFCPKKHPHFFPKTPQFLFYPILQIVTFLTKK